VKEDRRANRSIIDSMHPPNLQNDHQNDRLGRGSDLRALVITPAVQTLPPNYDGPRHPIWEIGGPDGFAIPPRPYTPYPRRRHRSCSTPPSSVISPDLDPDLRIGRGEPDGLGARLDGRHEYHARTENECCYQKFLHNSLPLLEKICPFVFGRGHGFDAFYSRRR
jgi:hypothetical protein